MGIGRIYAQAIGIALGVILGVWGAMMIGQQASDGRVADDKCWVQGGDYRNGTCRMPVDTMTDQQKVCMAMRGTYLVAKDKTTGAEGTTCYRDGKVLETPDTIGKQVIVMDDGTVMLVTK